MNPSELNSVKFGSYDTNFDSRQRVLKCRPQTGGHFVSVSIYQQPANLFLVEIDFYTEVINLYNHLIDLIHSLLCIFVFFPFSFWEQFTSTWKTHLMYLVIWFDCSPWWHFVPLPIYMARSSFHFKGPVTRYVKLRVANPLGMQGTFSPRPQSRYASRYVRDARSVMHAGIADFRFPLNSVVGKTFPAIPVHAQHAILCIR